MLWDCTDVPASAAYFGGYEILQRMMVPKGSDRNQLSVSKTIFAGGMAGIFFWLVAIPPDVLKSRLQTGKRIEGFLVMVLLRAVKITSNISFVLNLKQI